MVLVVIFIPSCIHDPPPLQMPNMALSSDDESEDDGEDALEDGDEVILNYFFELKKSTIGAQFVNQLCTNIYKRFLLFCSNRNFYEHPRRRRRPLR